MQNNPGNDSELRKQEDYIQGSEAVYGTPMTHDYLDQSILYSSALPMIDETSVYHSSGIMLPCYYNYIEPYHSYYEAYDGILNSTSALHETYNSTINSNDTLHSDMPGMNYDFRLHYQQSLEEMKTEQKENAEAIVNNKQELSIKENESKSANIKGKMCNIIKEKATSIIPLFQTYTTLNLSEEAVIRTPHRARTLSEPDLSTYFQSKKEENKKGKASRRGSLSREFTTAHLCIYPDCKRPFKRPEHLKRHYQSVHSTYRPYVCSHCDKRFARSDNLNQHLKTHIIWDMK